MSFVFCCCKVCGKKVCGCEVAVCSYGMSCNENFERKYISDVLKRLPN